MNVKLLASAFVATFVVWLGGGALVLLYFRFKSREVGRVLSSIEDGRTGARLSLNRFDVMSGLFPLFNQMAVRVDRAISKIRSAEEARLQLLRELAHDIRTPLTTIKTASESLAIPQLPATSSEMLIKMLQNETVYLETLIADLFVLSELEVKTAEAAPADIVPILCDEAERLRLAANVDVAVTSDGECSVRNALLARRLVSNILDNAVRAGSSHIAVRCSGHGDQLELSIDDDGPGMTSEQIASFGTKSKVRTFNARELRGSLGLGGVIIRALTTELGGTVHVENRPDQHGLRIRVVLPRGAPEQ